MDIMELPLSYALIISEGKVRLVELPSHAQTSIVTYKGEVKCVNLDEGGRFLTLVCCTITHNYAVISGDTMTNLFDGKKATTPTKLLKTNDLLVGIAGSAGALNVLSIIEKEYQEGNAIDYMGDLANYFLTTDEPVEESKYSQFLYVSKGSLLPFLGIVDTKGDHQLLLLETNHSVMHCHGIGQPNESIFEEIEGIFEIDYSKIEEVKLLHSKYIHEVSKTTSTVNNIVTHEVLIY